MIAFESHPVPSLVSFPIPQMELDPMSLLPDGGVDVTGTMCIQGIGGWVRVAPRPEMALRYNAFSRTAGGQFTVSVDPEGRTWLFDRQMELPHPWVRDSSIEMLRANAGD